jgi:hypothetical protein
MSYTKEELDILWKESVHREDALVKEYKRTHYIPGRATILTPEIQAERDKRKALYAEYRKLSQKS